jgi:hypothetical protein
VSITWSPSLARSVARPTSPARVPANDRHVRSLSDISPISTSWAYQSLLGSRKPFPGVSRSRSDSRSRSPWPSWRLFVRVV